MSNFIFSLASIFILWSALAYPLTGQKAIFGVILSLCTAMVVTAFSKTKKSFKISGVFHLLRFLFIFLWELIKANFNMARIVLTPTLPISPMIVEIETNINSPVGRAFLANAITLTPGTLSVDIDEEKLYIHVVEGDKLSNPSDISRPFENALREALD